MAQTNNIAEVAKVNEEGCAVKEENYQTLLKTVAIVFCTLAELFILVRLYVNVVIAKNFKNDDWVIATAGVSSSLVRVRMTADNSGDQHFVPHSSCNV